MEIDIKFDPKENQKFHKIRNGKDKVKLPIYNKADDMSGTVSVNLKDTKKYEHLGIKCYLIGFLGTTSHQHRDLYQQGPINLIHLPLQGTLARRHTNWKQGL